MIAAIGHLGHSAASFNMKLKYGDRHGVGVKGVRALERDKSSYVFGLWVAFVDLFLGRYTAGRMINLIRY